MILGKGWQSQSETSIDMTPMLDVVFILLIFFIVTSSVNQIAEVEVTPAISSQATAVRDTPVIITLDAAGRLFMGEDLLDIYYLPAKLNKLKADNPKVRLLLMADRDCPTGVTIKVLESAKQAGISMSTVAAVNKAS